MLVCVACTGYKGEITNQIIEHIENYYLSEEGIVLNFKNAENPQYLSESIGLYMQLLLGVRDRERFAGQVDILLDRFAVFKDDYMFIKWELGENTTVGALIDDLRIARVLSMAADIFEEEEYKKIAEKIIFTIKNTMIVDNRLVDFYDWHYNIAKDQLFLSYFIVEAMADFPDYVFKPLQELTASPFFDELYVNGKFLKASEDEVNMIDQSLIAVAYFRQVGEVEPNFQNFLQTRLEEDGKIFARYSRDTLRHVNENQSPATYAFLLHYFELTNQLNHAAKVRELLLLMETYNAEITHFFDFSNKKLALLGLL